METTQKRKPLKVTPLEQWKRNQDETEPIALPDGHVVRVRKLDLIDLAVTGYVPLKLTGALMATGQKLKDPEQFMNVSQEELAELNGMLRRVALRAVIEPKLSEADEPDALPVDELGILNLLAIFSASVDTAGAEAFRPFRGE